MSNLIKCEFIPLSVSGQNYLSWVLDAEILLVANGIKEPIEEENTTTPQQKAQALAFLRRHLDEGLKAEYLTVRDPLILWNKLKARYEHQRTVILPKAQNDWNNLRLQDFKSITEYNSAIFSISSRLELCGQKVTEQQLLEKTFSTFHASNVLLQQQYRERHFQTFSELISVLLLAEQNNELLLKNHEARPTGATAFPEANVVASSSRQNYTRGRGRGRGRGWNRYKNRGGYARNVTHHQKWENTAHPQKRENYNEQNQTKKVENLCYRCGMKGHWSRTCRTPKHLADLYQESVKNKGKKKDVEANFANSDGNLEGYDDPIDVTHLDVSDFYAHPEGKIDHLVGDIVDDGNAQFE